MAQFNLQNNLTFNLNFLLPSRPRRLSVSLALDTTYFVPNDKYNPEITFSLSHIVSFGKTKAINSFFIESGSSPGRSRNDHGSKIVMFKVCYVIMIVCICINFFKNSSLELEDMY